MSARPLGLLEAAVNRALSLDPEAARVLAPLQGKRIGVRIEGVAPAGVQVLVSHGAVVLLSGDAPDADADVTVSGTAVALASLLTRSAELPAGTGVSVHGDAGLLLQARRVFASLRPDWEEPLARLLGDELGYPLARGLRHAGGVLARAVRELGADAGEYLREESGLVAARDQVSDFAAAVDELRDGVERLDKRVLHLERDLAQRP